jgi:hypothetical protein
MGLGSPASLLVGPTRPPVPLVVVPAKAKVAKAAEPLLCAAGRTPSTRNRHRSLVARNGSPIEAAADSAWCCRMLSAFVAPELIAACRADAVDCPANIAAVAVTWSALAAINRGSARQHACASPCNRTTTPVATATLTCISLSSGPALATPTDACNGPEHLQESW